MKETSKSLLFSFPARECAQALCDTSDCFHTLHRLQRIIKKKMNFYNKILYSKDLDFTYHSNIYIYKDFYKEQKSYASYDDYNPSRKIKKQSK